MKVETDNTQHLAGNRFTVFKSWRRSVRFGAICVAIFVGAQIVAAPFICRGNQAARFRCGQIRKNLLLGSDGKIHFLKKESLTTVELQEASRLANYHWTGTAKYWVRVAAGDQDDKLPIVLCDRAFFDLSGLRPFHALLGRRFHSVCYAGGGEGLVSEKEFARLDLTNFVSLTEIAPH